MIHTYTINGMTCTGCIAKVKEELLKLSDITAAEVQLLSPQATITMSRHIDTAVLQKAISNAGRYTITMMADRPAIMEEPEKKSWLQTYRPLLLLFGFIGGIATLSAFYNGQWHLMIAMRHFMAGFFLAFSFFKLLDIQGFADSYSSYDVLAKRWHGYGFVYPFIELVLGVAYLLNVVPGITNIVTILVMGFSTIGVVNSVINKRKIRCACLGVVFNLPMSTITIVEDVLMVIMAIVALCVL